MEEKIAVIGSNSFSGSHFVDFALGMGMNVIGVSRSAELNPVFLPYKARQKPKFRFYRMDLNYDLGKMMKLIYSFQPEYVVNFAAQSMVGESWQHPEHWFQTNVVSSIKLHDQLRKCDFLKKYVHISTPEVYGNCSGLVKENNFYNPSTPYAVSKAAVDMSLSGFHRNYGFPVVFTRAANVFGPGQQLYRIIPKTIICFLLGKKIPLHGGGRSVRSFIHIKDVCDGTFKVCHLGKPGEVFHFSTDRQISIASLVEIIAKKMNVSFKDNTEIVDDRPGKDAAYLLDSSKARDLLGWQAKTGLEEGIDQTIAWVKDNFKYLKKQSLAYVHKA